MKSVLFVGLCQAIFAGILIFTQKPKERHNYILGVWVMIIAFQFVCDLLSRYQSSSILADYNFIIIPFLQGPLIYLYSLFTINREQKLEPKHFLHLIPFLAFSILFFSPFGHETFRRESMTPHINHFEIIMYLYGVAIIISVSAYSIGTYKLINSSGKYLKEVYSSESFNLSLKWIKLIVNITLFVFFTFYLLASLNVSFFHIEYDPGFLLNIGYVLIVYVISFFGFRQRGIFSSIRIESNKVENTEAKERYKKSGLKPQQAQEYIKRINMYMAENKPYLDTEFSIYKLSEDLNISQYYITQSLNETLGKNFYTYVNEYRVEEAKKKLLDPKNDHLTVLGVGFESGFNSKSTFYSIFKKKTGQSPSNFKKSHVSDL